MRKILARLALIGALVTVGACTGPGTTLGAASGPAPAQAPPITALGRPWSINGATFTVDTAARPAGYPGDPRPRLEIVVHVDNAGKDDVVYPDPAVTYNGTAVAVTGWTQPPSGAMIGPGHSGDFRSAFPAPNPGARLVVRLQALVGTAQTPAFWTGIIT